MPKLNFWMCALVVLISFAISCSGKVETVIHGKTMGTTYTIKIIHKQNTISEELIRKAVENQLDKVNTQMSTYRNDSEISEFNRLNTKEWFAISQEFLSVLMIAKQVSEESDGAFDITVAPLVNLWGFGPVRKKNEDLPDETQISKILKSIGYEKLKINENISSISKVEESLILDLSAIAKGFAVDLISEKLYSIGFNNFMVEVGGEIRTSGLNVHNEKWNIGIANPDGTQTYGDIIELSDISTATSGDYRNYIEKNGVRYSHTIDPTTGNPVTHNLVSVTVILDTCVKADAYATAFNTMGFNKGLELSEKLNIPACFIVKEKDVFNVKFNRYFKHFLKNKPYSGEKENTVNTIEQLIAADKEFANDVSKMGLAAWLDWLSQDAVIFSTNYPIIKGKKSIKEHYNSVDFNPLNLKWAPVGGKISNCRTLGYTYGNWTFEYKDKDGKLTISKGKYLSVWEKQADGSWKVCADIGNSDQ